MKTATSARPSLDRCLPPARTSRLIEATRLVTVEDTGSAVVARLARPEKCNPLSLEVMGELDTIVQDLLSSGTSRPFILRGSGRWFASGGDLKQFATFTAEEAVLMAHRMAGVLRAIERLPGPTIAALNGPAIGGGVELALAFDMRVASASSYLRFAQTRMGITTGWQGIERLCGLVGYSTALYLMLTGGKVAPEEAYRLGLVNAVWQAESFDAKLDALVQALLEAGEAGLAVKRVLRETAARSSLSTGELEREMLRSLWDRPEQLKAMTGALGHRSASHAEGSGLVGPNIRCRPDRQEPGFAVRSEWMREPLVPPRRLL